MTDLKNRAWLEVDLDALANNIKNIRAYVSKDAMVMAVVKANAYGHGVIESARVMIENGADYLAVACLDEALQLRKSGFACPIFILGFTEAEYAEILVEHDITSTCCDYNFAMAIAKEAKNQGKTAKIHIKVDTGMGRIGLICDGDEQTVDNTVNEIRRILSVDGLFVEGIFTHFSVADREDDEYTLMQYSRFKYLCDRLDAEELNIPIKHCCNSSALVKYPHMHMGMVRAGIILYGYEASYCVDCSALSLIPAAKYCARITNVKNIKAGVSVGYGRKYISTEPRKIASIAIGYADGYFRRFANNADIIAGGRISPIVGNICMDQCMADVSDTEGVKIGDTAVLFGRDGDVNLPLEALADRIDTIIEEILCNIGKRIPRIYTRGGKITASLNSLFDAPLEKSKI